jgi:shikimate dehydrogenase
MQIFGILGRNISHSFSPAMHNAGFEYLKLDARYLVFDIEKKDLSKFIKQVKNENIKGFSVTVPYKEEIIKYLDKISFAAKKIGAVNTVINKNGVLIGDNTDFLGAVNAIGKKNIKNKNILVLGAGGAARAIIYGLKKYKAKICVINRTVQKAKNLAKYFGVKYDVIENFSKYRPDIIINTTILGMSPDYIEESPYPKNLFEKNQIIMDIVYRPLKTKFLQDAEEKGAKIIKGDKMLFYQGILQFKMFTNLKAPKQIMKDSLIKI